MNASVSRVSAMVSFSRMSAVLCLLFAVVPLCAEPKTEQEVAAAVETWLQGVITDARADAAVERMEPYVVDGATVAYIVHLAGGGFCLSGADDLVLPVYFYSPEGTYDPDDPNHQFILWEITARLAAIKEAEEKDDPKLESYVDTMADRSAMWADLSVGRAPARGRADPEMLILPLTSIWSQRSPYNDWCPSMAGPPGHPAPPEEHPKVGCVALATAQTMYYWQWPETGVGSYGTSWAFARFDDWEATQLATDPGIDSSVWQGRLEWHSGPVAMLRASGDWDNSAYKKAQEISDDPAYLGALAELWSRVGWHLALVEADFGATTYDWDLMHDEHVDGDGAPDDEVAKLCFHVGVAVKMDWGLFLSTAQTGDVVNALYSYFKYYIPHYSNRSIAAMTEEIQWLRPLVIRGNRPGQSVGHAWVAYGYDTATDPNTSFMMNLGRGGDDDGWYVCDDVDLGYTANQQHVIRIAPGSVAFVGNGATGNGWPATPYGGIAAAVDEAADGTTLIFKSGSTNTFAGTSLVIDRPYTLKGYDITIVHE